MGNTIKNYERKKRRERKEAYREIRQITHDFIMQRMGFSNSFIEREREVFDNVNKLNWLLERKLDGIL